MIFEIRRARQWMFDENEQPCDGAFIMSWKGDILPEPRSNLFLAKCWCVEFDTLEDLLALEDGLKNSIIIRESAYPDIKYCIIICDIY